MAKKKAVKKLTRKEHDLPRYPVIYKYEDDFKNGFKKMNALMLLDITKKLKGYIK